MARHASGVNAGGVRLLGRDMAEVPLSKASMEMWQSLDEDLQADTGFRATSLINIAVDEADLATLKRPREVRMQAAGFTHERIIGREELRDRLPHVHPSCVGGVISATDGLRDPLQGNECLPFGRRTPRRPDAGRLQDDRPAPRWSRVAG